MAARRQSQLLRYVLLAALFAVAASFQARYSYDEVRQQLRGLERARRPFELAYLRPVISTVQPEAEAAGLRPGAAVVAIEGRPCTGLASLSVPVGRARAGDILEVTVRDGESIAVRLAPAESRPPGLIRWTLTLVLLVAMPALCLLLGFWVAAVRPFDPLVWILLGLMLSFSQVAADPVNSWEGWPRAIGLTYQILCKTSWAIWMFLFGICFPERLALDRRRPWLKWLVLIPLLCFVVSEAILAVGGAASFASVRPLGDLVAPVQIGFRILSMAAIGVFFMALGFKSGTATTPDVRRRLYLLHTGASISLGPIFLVVVYAMVRGAGIFEGVPAWVAIPTLLLLCLFPVTLAYVIVVHRALDVRVVIRQGVQYALARRGVIVLQALVILAIGFGMLTLLTRPNTRRVEILAIVSAGMGLVLIMRRAGERLSRWIDRRFFRDAYSAEQVLSDLGDQVRTMVETGPLLQTVAQRLSESLHVSRVALLLSAGGSYRPAHAIGYGADLAVCLPEGSVTVDHLRRSHEPLRVYLDDPTSWVNKAQGPGETERAILAALDTQLLLPLAVKEKLPGIISMGPKLSEEPYSGSDLKLLQSVATQTALALENSRLTEAITTEVARRERLNREVEIAREVQERLFPQKLPEVKGLDYCGSCRPALRVGGDYYDFLPLPGGGFGFAIGDVSGKGIGAALLMASLQASLRGQTLQNHGDLSTVMANVNRLVYDASPDNRYATFFYAQYDAATLRLRYVNAGHCAPIILRSGAGGAQVIRLKAGGTVIGLFETSRYQEAAVDLKPGDLLVAFTDGISEALNQDDEEWGEQNLIDAAGRRAGDGAAAAEIMERLMCDVDAFVAGADQHDDMTLVVARIL